MRADDGQRSVHKMMFTIEFFRIRKEDNARAMLDRITHIASDLESAKVKAKSLFDTLNMPQNPDFGPEWARGVLLDAEDGGFLETRMVRVAATNNNYLDFAGLREPPCKFSSRHRRGDVYFDARSGPTTGRKEFQTGRARAGCSKSNGGI